REKRHRVALGVEDVYEPAAAPIPAFLASLGAAAPHSRSRDALGAFARSKKDLPDLEQRDVARAAAGVALDRHDEARNEARAPVGEIGGGPGWERRRSGWRARASATRRRTVPPRLWARTTRSPPRAATARQAFAWRGACASA